MKSKHQNQDTTKRSSRYFCGLSRRARSSDARLSQAPPPNSIPVSTAAPQQRSNNGQGFSSAHTATLPHRQTATRQASVGAQVSRDGQPRGLPPQYDLFARPLQAVPVEAPIPQIFSSRTTPLYAVATQAPAPRVLMSYTLPTQVRQSHIPPLSSTNPVVHPSPPSVSQPHSISNPSPLLFPKILSFPREIRDLIWLRMLRDLNLPDSLPVNQIRKALPAFCSINRQVFCETVPLFLQANCIELGSKEDAKKLFQFLNHVPNGEAYRGVRSLRFQNCWAWTSVSAIPFLREVLAKCSYVRHITLEVTQKFIYEPVYYNPPWVQGPPPSRSEHRKWYIHTHLLPDLHRLFVHGAASLRRVRLRGSGKHDALQISKMPQEMQAEEWLDHLVWSGTIDDPKPPDALLDMDFAEWKNYVKSKEERCSPWMEDLMSRIPQKTYDATNFTGSSNYSSFAPSSPLSASSVDTPSAYIPFFFASTSPRPGPTIYESSDYYSASGYESGGYEESGFELPRSRDRTSGFWSSGAQSPGHRSSAPNYRPDFIRPGL